MKKKYLLFSLIIVVCILVTICIVATVSRRNTIHKLLYELESSINENNLKGIINLYPDYYHDTVSDWLSQDKLNEFNNKVGNIKIKMTFYNDYDSESASKDIQDRIFNDYGVNLKIENHQIIVVNVTNNVGVVFEQVELQVVKIQGEYYLYAESYLGGLIQCFVE
ncbi:MAG: hypothetical protein HDQ95_07790 [Roseburia sp.]|nr:hypothetical protein [Roseburia sp.]